mgnify:CR=1 FL=1
MNLRTFFATLISLITLSSYATGPEQIVFHGRIFVAGADRAGSTLTITTDGQEPELIMAAIDGTYRCLLYTSDAADERSSVDLGGRRIIKKKNQNEIATTRKYK